MNGPNEGEEPEPQREDYLIEEGLDGSEGGGGSYGHPREDDDHEDQDQDEDR